MASVLKKKLRTTKNSPLAGVDFSSYVQLASDFNRHALATHRFASIDMEEVRWCDLRTAGALAAFISWMRKQRFCAVQVNLPHIRNGSNHLTISELLSESSRGNKKAQQILGLFRFLTSFGWFRVLASVDVPLVPYGIKELARIQPYSFRTASPDAPEATQSDVVFDLFSGRFTNRAEVETFAEKNHFWEWFQQLGLKSHSEEMGSAVSLLFHDEATRMLQNRPFSDWACFLLACSVRQQMPELELVFICATAPARLLADGISDKIHFAPPVFDIGHWFNFRQSPVLRGLTTPSRDATAVVPPPDMVLVTDLVNTGRFLLEMRRCTKDTTGALPTCAVSLMRRTRNTSKPIEFNPRWSDIVDSLSGESISVFSLFDYCEAGLAQANREYEAIIDYYGMHPYSRRQLIEGARIEAGYVVEPSTDVDRLRMDRVRGLDIENIIRFGHYVHEDKHFTLVAAMRDLFLESAIGGEIVKEVAQLIRQSSVKHILIPAHSHIKYIIPRLRAAMQEHMPPVTTLVENRQVAPRPFYFLPQELTDTLAKEARPSMLLLDDGARSGRTFETIVRAVARAVEDRPVSWTFYLAINRMGIARTTTLDQLSRRGAGRDGRCIYFYINLEYVPGPGGGGKAGRLSIRGEDVMLDKVEDRDGFDERSTTSRRIRKGGSSFCSASFATPGSVRRKIRPRGLLYRPKPQDAACTSRASGKAVSGSECRRVSL